MKKCKYCGAETGASVCLECQKTHPVPHTSKVRAAAILLGAGIPVLVVLGVIRACRLGPEARAQKDWNDCMQKISRISTSIDGGLSIDDFNRLVQYCYDDTPSGRATPKPAFH